jgi:hypothetical protein
LTSPALGASLGAMLGSWETSVNTITCAHVGVGPAGQPDTAFNSCRLFEKFIFKVPNLNVDRLQQSIKAGYAYADYSCAVGVAYDTR